MSYFYYTGQFVSDNTADTAYSVAVIMYNLGTSVAAAPGRDPHDVEAVVLDTCNESFLVIGSCLTLNFGSDILSIV